MISFTELPSVDGRPVIRCNCCGLVQFRHDRCVKSGKALSVEAPKERLIPSIPASPVPHKKRFTYDWGFAFRLCRIASGKSQNEIALMMDRWRTFYSRLENGRVSPTLETCEAMSRAMGISMAELAQVAQVLGEQVPERSQQESAA